MSKATRVYMVRRDLAGIPSHAIPGGYSLRWYRHGDKETWLRIHALAETEVPTSGEIYDAQFEGNEVELTRRQAFLVDAQGEAIGTASAWYGDETRGREWGRVHWVAIVPAHQGLGLAKPLMTAILNRLADVGHRNAYLTTWSTKLPAINLYRSLGFEPEIHSDEDRRVWKQIQSKVK